MITISRLSISITIKKKQVILFASKNNTWRLLLLSCCSDIHVSTNKKIIQKHIILKRILIYLYLCHFFLWLFYLHWITTILNHHNLILTIRINVANNAELLCIPKFAISLGNHNCEILIMIFVIWEWLIIIELYL